MNRWDAAGLVLLVAAGGALFAAPESEETAVARPRPELDAAMARLTLATAARADGRHDHFDALVGSLGASVGTDLPASLADEIEEIERARAGERKRPNLAEAHAVERAVVAAARELGRLEHEPDATPPVGAPHTRIAACALIASAAIAWVMGARRRHALPAKAPRFAYERRADPPEAPDPSSPYGRVLEIVPVSE
jgi:hypothetical protein